MFLAKKKSPPETQRSIHNGAEIFETIKVKLQGASHSIKIAATWFTDNELFQILLRKIDQEKGCSIEIILDDNKENYWLPFVDLIAKGASVRLSKGFGNHGRMHEKFCIIDDRLLISGSYNWSKNARTENHENVILTEHATTVQEFSAKFAELTQSSSTYEAVRVKADENEDALASESKSENSLTKQFEKVLDEMIFSSVTEYDRESLVKKGFERSEKCSGDSNIIYNELNTVYTEMLNSISTAEQKKEILKARVDAHLQENVANLSEACSRAKEQLTVEEETEINSWRKEIDFLKENNVRITEEITKIEQSDIVNNNERISFLSEQKKEIQAETVKMPFRWYIDIPTYLGLLGVFTYIVCFYSSAAYILMFSERNATIARLANRKVEEIGIYYAKAIPNAYSENIFELLIILFVPFFLVCGMIYLKKLDISKIIKVPLKLLCLILVDGFTAVAVARSIHETKYLAGQEKEHFKLVSVFSDMNFYLVLIFGMLSLLVFDLIMSYVIKSFSNKNDLHLRAKQKARIATLDEEIAQVSKLNTELLAAVTNKKALIAQNQYSISQIEQQIELRPGLTKRKLGLLEDENHTQIMLLEHIVRITHNKIDNELFAFSTHFIKDRINIFLQGWNNFIYSYFAKDLSEKKVDMAKTNANNWLNEYFLSQHSRKL